MKKIAYPQGWQDAYESFTYNIETSASSEDVTAYGVWVEHKEMKEDKAVESLIKNYYLTKAQAKALLVYRPPIDYSKATQQQALLLFQALLVFNALVEEFSTSGAKDLKKHLRILTEAIIKFERKSEAFDSLKGMMLSGATRNLSNKLETRLRLVKGILNTRQEMFVASRSVLLFANSVQSSQVQDLRGQLHSNLRNSFKELIDAKASMTKLSQIAFTVQIVKGIKSLKDALKEIFADYSPITRTASVSAEQQALMKGLANIKKKPISEQEKIQKQQELIAQSGLDDDVKTFIEVMSNADVLVNSSDLETEIGQQLGLTLDQEKAMLGSTTGLTLISAGAGSGKTRVLSGKVVNLVDDPNVSEYNIMAVSFSKKSAQDLAEKVKQAAGSKIAQMSHTAIGRTTHSVALEIVNRFDSEAGNKDLVSNEHELKALVDQAIKLVRETPSTGGRVEAESIFKNRPEYIHLKSLRNDLSVLGLLISVEKYREVKKQLGKGEAPVSDRLKALRKKLIKKETPDQADIDLVREILNNTSRGTKVLNRAFGGEPKKYQFYNRRKISSTKNPQWWGHMGVSEKEVKVSAKECQLFITKCKANMVSPTEAYNKVKKSSSSDSFLFKSKVYAAYEHLKGEGSLMDFDDMLIRAVQVLSLKKNLDTVKSQYKHIIVDEAQDLNPVQHAFFGLISGTMEPGNTKGSKPPKPAENIVQDSNTSYTLIGDENQSIYGFRGATSQEFSSRAESSGGNFDVMTLGINFRSKKGIVEAANKLISTDEGSLGMTCTAIYQGVDSGEEAISQDTDHDSSLSAASSFAKKVALGIDSDFETYKASDYGVACRTNAELIPYTLALLEQDIPFVSPVSPFDHPTTKKLVRALSIVGFDYDKGKENQVGSFYGALLNFHKDMKLGLPKDINTVFKKHLHNRLSKKEILAQYDELNDTTFVPFNPSTLDELSPVNQILYGACTDEAMDSYSDAEKKSISMYCVIVRQLNIVAETAPADLFDMLIGAKELAPNYTLKNSEGKTLKDIILESTRNSTEEMEDALTSIHSEEMIKELKTVDFAIAPLNALRSIFIKGLNEKKTASEVLQKIADMSTASLAAKNNSRELTDDKVILDTVHGWKGLEVTHLTVPMVKGKFPYEREEEFDPILYENQDQFEKQKLEQERKLAYVAITRGKKSVTVQSYKNTNSGKETEESEYISILFGEDGCRPKKSAKLNVARQILAETTVVLGDDMTETEIDLAIKMYS